MRFGDVCVTAAFVFGLGVLVVQATTAYDERLLDSVRAQVALSADIPVSDIALCGAHRVFNSRAYYPPQYLKSLPAINQTKGSCIAGRCLRGYIDIDSQRASVSQLLEWGVRRISIDIHYISGFGLRLCRGDSHFHRGCRNLKDEVKKSLGIDFDVCGTLLGVPSLTSDTTGCTTHSVTYENGLRQIADWLSTSPSTIGPAADILVVDMIDHVTDVLGNVSSSAKDPLKSKSASALQDALKRLFNNSGYLFSPAQLAEYRSLPNTDDRWPTPRELAKKFNSARVIFLADDDSMLVGDFVHARPSSRSAAGKDINAAKRFSKGACTLAPFSTFYESLKVMSLAEIDSAQRFVQTVSDENGPAEVGRISADNAQSMLACGISPLMERLSPTKVLSSCVWTWGEGSKAPLSTSNDCIIFTSKGVWSSKPCDRSSIRKACRRKTAQSVEWKLSEAGQNCSSGYKFALPATPQETEALKHVVKQASISSALLPSVAGISMDKPSAPSSKSSSSGLSTGAIVGIVVACIFVVVLIVIIAVVVIHRRTPDDGSQDKSALT